MPYNLLVEGIKDGGCMNMKLESPISVKELKVSLKLHQHLDPNCYYLSQIGCPLREDHVIESDDWCTVVVRVHPLLMGGKGGFGTLIRSMGSQINKNKSKGACRDLSGRRMKDVDTQKKLAKWMAEEPERKREKARETQRKKDAKIKEPKHYFDDPTYMDQIRSTEEGMDTALKQGLQAATTSGSNKRKLTTTGNGEAMTKKQKIWFGVDDSGDSEDDGIDSDSDDSQSGSEESGSDGAGPSGLVTGVSEKRGSDGAGPSGYGLITGPGVSEKRGSDGAGPSGLCTCDESESIRLKESVDVNTRSETNGEISPVKQTTCAESNGQTLIDVEKFISVEELLSVGGDTLKATLQSLGLKCGGTPEQRAQRLFSIKGKTRDQYDKTLFAKPKKQNRIK